MSDSENDDDEESSGPSVSPRDIAVFVLHATQANRGLCVLVAAAVIALGYTLSICIPLSYESSARVYVQDSGTVTTAIASGRDRRAGEVSRGLEELLIARDNLASLVREAKIYERWPLSRPGPLRVKDAIVASLFKAPSRADLEQGYVQMLAKSLSASKEGDVSVRIRAQWRDPAIAFDLARLATRNFLAARAAQELEPIRRALPFLEEQQRAMDEQIESAVARLSGTASAKPDPVPAGGDAAQVETPAAKKPNPAMLEFVALTRQLAEVRREQRELVAPQRQRVTELKTRLQELRALYSEEHPLVLQQQARIAAANADSPELLALKERESKLREQLAARNWVGTNSGDSKGVGLTAQLQLAAQMGGDDSDPERASIQSRLGAALSKSAELTARLDTARVELAAAEADFQHRYVVIEPPEMPARPLKPRQTLALAVSFAAALLLAIASAVLRELRRGRIIEPWQVRSLGLPVLGEVKLGRLPAPGTDRPD